ncbi:hypothetical protein EW026_g5763 [Hermanssonia centrifuga]|uniref:P-loop containing nucleoside triphosphate hydrolase protein n=1 Tax=Hermanssonia centrifuga TaxID=98765 RepID=A0A4S4KD24_9APHY|nr:hypothetical protein EW026_g5763 [Hermanssonia centrifuga]
MDALKSLVQPLVGGGGGSSMIDGMKLVVLGGTVETARRVASSGWSHFINSFFLTAHFSEEDYPYDWLMLWLSRRPEWQRSREFETTTRTSTPGFGTRLADNSFGDDDDENEDIPGKVKTRVVFQPTANTTHTIYYRGHWLRVRRGRKNDGSGSETLSISVVARNNSILKQLVLQAKKEYEAEAVHRIQIYFADSHGCWRWTDSRHKRPMSSIVLNPGVKEMLLSDTKDFLKSEKWYADRGIPFRRGYLLHGVPGSGKSSLIHAIAGELMLDIYVVSLSSSWISDGTLTTLMGRVPARCIVLLEDLDAAFTRSTSRDDESTGSPDSSKTATVSNEPTDFHLRSSRRHRTEHLSDVNTLSLSGLLNALDGVAASEGRILFATTNHLERLDPALSRPGRMDVNRRRIGGYRTANYAPFTYHRVNIRSVNIVFHVLVLCRPVDKRIFSIFVFMFRTSAGDGLKNQAYLPPSVEEEIAAFKHSSPPLDGNTLSKLAKDFADSIPDEEFSVAALQGYLLKNKSRPEDAAHNAAAWVVSEREMRERLKKERELKEKQAREKRRKELLEKAEEKKKAEEEASKKALEAEKNKTEEKAKREAEETAAAEAELKQLQNEAALDTATAENKDSDSESDVSSSGTSTPAEPAATWVKIEDSSN